jgi:hypothetical protein
MFINRLTAFTKRILSGRLYIAMLCLIILMSIIYALLPGRLKSTDIKVGIYTEDTLLYSASDFSSGSASISYSDMLFDALDNSNSIYTYCPVTSLEELRRGVESGEFECGFYIPDGFFTGYINGEDENKIIRYETSKTTLGSAVTESVFSRIFTLCAADILYLAYDNPSYNETLKARLDTYLTGDKIFQIEDCSENRIIADNETVSINLPIRQLSVLLIVFSGLLGLLMYVGDAEKNIYMAKKAADKLLIRLATLLGAVIPIFLTAFICCVFTYKSFSAVIPLVLSAIIIILLAFFPGIFIKKSSSLSRLLPVIMLILIPLTLLL